MKYIRIVTLVLYAYVALLTLSACRATRKNYSSISPRFASTPTLPSDTANRKIYGWNCVTFDSSGNATIQAACRGDPNNTHVKGVAYVIQWSAYEPTDG